MQSTETVCEKQFPGVSYVSNRRKPLIFADAILPGLIPAAFSHLLIRILTLIQDINSHLLRADGISRKTDRIY